MTSQMTDVHVNGNAGAQAQTNSNLSRYRYLNPDFMPNHVNEEFCRQHRASGLAGDLWALVSTIESAFDSESGVPIANRGISTTLGLATNLAGDLIELCETLEKDLARAQNSNEQNKHSPDVATKPELKGAKDRLKRFAEWTGTTPPESILNDDGSPTEELRAFCRTEGMSLDWLFLGDVKGLVMARHYNAKEAS